MSEPSLGSIRVAKVAKGQSKVAPLACVREDEKEKALKRRLDDDGDERRLNLKPHRQTGRRERRVKESLGARARAAQQQ